LEVSLKAVEDIEVAVEFFKDTIYWVSWNATPEHTEKLKPYDCPILTN
jgi:hypothetical protein